MKIDISFADLSHMEHFCNATPYGISLVAAYALKAHENRFNAKLFKHAPKLIQYLEQSPPKIACFSNYIWNTNLSYTIAEAFKFNNPDSIVVFGGPNYAIDPEVQEDFMFDHPAIDFYIFREGEVGFSQLLEQLYEFNFDIAALKEARPPISNCHYVRNGNLYRGELLAPIKNLDEIPSPYLSGLMDEFLDELTPLTETTRGCPFQCTFCQDGHKYANNIRRYSKERIKEELTYIAPRAKSPKLMTADLNFGMYPQDIEVCHEISAINEKHDWPLEFDGFSGKNKKERVMEGVKILDKVNSYMNAAVQSLDDNVLRTIKRKNISYEKMIGIAQQGQEERATSFAEVILGLPGDSKEAHFNSVNKLMDADMSVVRSHQFIMLNGSESAQIFSRKKHGLITGHRVVPQTAQPFKLYGETVAAPEIDEICVGSNTMSFEDYQECRMYNLTIEIFYNNGIFRDLHTFLSRKGIKNSTFIQQIHEYIRTHQTALTPVYDDFLRETNEIWSNRKDLDEFLKKPGIIEKYNNGELGNNEQLVYRAVAIFNHMPALHKIAYRVAKNLLQKQEDISGQHFHYIEELAKFSLWQKENLFEIDKHFEQSFHYNFVALKDKNYDDDPATHLKPNGLKIKISHSDEQKNVISRYLQIYGTSYDALGNILSGVTDINNLYRKTEILG